MLTEPVMADLGFWLWMAAAEAELHHSKLTSSVRARLGGGSHRIVGEPAGQPLSRGFMDTLHQISTCTSIVEEAPLLQKAPLIGAAPTGCQQAATATCKSATARPCVGS